MAARRRSRRRARARRASTKGRRLPAAPVACTAVEHADTVTCQRKAATFRRRPKIHRRRVIPAVRRGAAVADAAPTTPMRLRRPRALARTAAARRALAIADDIVLTQNVELGALADNDTASDVCEPSVAAKGDVVFFTGNWFAALSTNQGASFQYVNPYTAFPDPPGMMFCCDQVVHYMRRIDTFVWLLQYTENAAGANLQRLAFARTADVRQGRWWTVDITPQALGLGDQFLDFPDLAVGNNMLYVTTNVFSGSAWTTSVILRLPFAGIRSGNVTARRATSTQNFNFRMAQHCATTAYFASHEDTSTLRVFSWRETDASPTFRDVTVPSWSAGNYQSITPDGRNWLGRADPRVLGGTRARRNVFFAWGSSSGGANARPHPFVQVAKIDTRTFALRESINIWDADSAVAYPSLATNSRQQVGVSFMLGGGPRFPSHVVGTLTGPDRYVVARAGTRGPQDPEWGDYLTLRRRYPNPKLFVGAGYTKRTGSGNVDATPNFVVFGRSGHV